MKRFLALLLCVATLLCLTACSEPAESTDPSSSEAEVTPVPGMTEFSKTPSAGLEYSVNEDEISCTITGIGTCKDAYIFVGNEIDGLAVTAIGASAFYGNKDIKGVRLGDNVVTVGAYAFFECAFLEQVLLGNVVASLEAYAFAGCGKLKTITIPESVKQIDAWAFYDCHGLEAVHIADLASWCAIAFGGAYANPVLYAENLYLQEMLLTTLILPEETVTIGQWAFAGCTSLTEVQLHGSLESIAPRAFLRCTNLTAIHYDGTKEQWAALEKGSYWNFKIDDMVITCIDGEV